MSIITIFLAVVTEPQFKLARDLTAMAIADGQVTLEEKEAMSTICHFQVIASRMGLNQMDVIGLFLLTTTRNILEAMWGLKSLLHSLKILFTRKGKRTKAAERTFESYMKL